MSTHLIFLLLFYLVAPCCVAQLNLHNTDSYPTPQYSENGNFYFKNYTAQLYDASPQNWGALQNKYGIMVFANGDGVLTYDGKIWTLTETPTQSVIRSLAIGEDGKIFVGALDDFGYLKRNQNGSLSYESLLNLVKQELHAMGNIWSTHFHHGFAYFESEIGMFCWNGERIRYWPWPNPDTYHKSFLCNDTFYVYEEGLGLMRFENDQFVPASGGDFFKKTRIYSMLPLDKNRILVGTRYDGLFIYSGRDVKPFNTQADAFLKEKQIYTGTLLSDGTFAFGTRFGGIVSIDRNGVVRFMITKENGLTTNSILSLTVDQNDVLWVGHQDGISKVEINNNFNTYVTKAALEGAPNDVCRYNNRLYVASNMGLFVLHPSSYPEKQSYFEKIPNVNSTCWSLLHMEGRLLVASNEGLLELTGGKLHSVTKEPSYSIHRYKGDPNRIVVAQNNKLRSYNLRNGQWREAGTIENIHLDNIKFNETQVGKLWLTTFSQGATLVSFTQPDGSTDYDKAAVKSFGPAEGLPEGFNKISTIGQKESFRIGTQSDLYQFDYSTNRFYPDSLLASRYGLEKGISPIANESASGRFMVKTKRKEDGRKQLIVIKPALNNTFDIQRFDIARIFESVGVFSYAEGEDLVWYGGPDGLIRHRLVNPARDSTTFSTYLNKIILLGDSVFFSGISSADQNLTFPYSSNSFRFEFTSTNFVAEEANVFQYMLEGYDKEWSDWTTENIKEYSSMWEGNYKFIVRSRNYAGVMGQPDVFSFAVAPPWFRSYYAYTAYLLGVALLVWGIIRWRSYTLIKEREELQAEIAHQTQEIRQQNQQLAEQSEELKVNAEQLKELDTLKSNFFVNISHEFRTPLSLILGPLEKSIQEKEPSNIRLTELERMHRNAKRLQQLINQLLDLAKLESGSMRVTEHQSDFIYFLRVLTASFESLAEIRNIRYEVQIPPHVYDARFDNDKVETVLFNLLSNAFKFTPDGGRIDFRVKLPEGDDQMVSIAVSDTGPGIPPSEVTKIFDRFYQVDSSSSREYEGSGIGLSLVKELVSLMKGHIDVQSDLKSGTTFTVFLPIKANAIYLEPEIYENRPQENGFSEIEKQNSTENKKEKASLSVNEPSATESLILLIEDNEDLRTYLKENLENDYQIVLAENGKIGLEKALELTPDLILSDMMMPLMDGFTLCTKIRQDERTSHIPFILLTARTTIESKLEGLELGADDYMTKPFNIKEIKVRIKNLLDQRTSLRKSFSREVTIQPKNISVTSVDERFLNNALAIVESHLADEQFSVERFAEEIGMSRKNLLRKIKALTDQSVNEFVRNFRLNRAAQLIEGQSATISEIAYQVGFNNLSYFSKCFKELFGVLPNEYASKKSAVS